ncbi:MAG: sensor histidine kinase [Flavobacteriales bacterium]
MFGNQFKHFRLFQLIALVAILFISISVCLLISVNTIREKVERHVYTIGIISKIEARTFSITSSLGEINQNELLYQLELLSNEGLVEILKSEHIQNISEHSTTIRSLSKLCNEVNVFWMQNAKNVSYLQGPLKDELVRLNLVSKQAVAELRKMLREQSTVLSTYWDYTMIMLISACVLAIVLSMLGYYLKKEVEERRKVELDLAMREKELDAFIYRVTHNIKLPVVGVISAVRVAKNDAESVAEALDDIQQKALYMNQMINDLMEWTKLENKSPENQQFDIAELVENIKLALKSRENNFKLTIINHLPSTFYTGDKALVNVVLYTLISNASKHTKSDEKTTEIEVTFDQNVNSICISVADNGMGIPNEVVNTVFKKFFKHGQQAGSGLGLHIASEAAQKLGGWLKYSQSKSGGATFSLFLPYRQK